MHGITSYEGMNKYARRREQRQVVRAELLRTRHNNDFTRGIGSQLFPLYLWSVGNRTGGENVIKITEIYLWKR
jgi:hypothetical protein